jgi:CheY-like chemotaxis protein
MRRIGTAGARVLLVDAEAGSRESLRRALQEAGYEVVMAESGSAAAGMLERECPDVVVSRAKVCDMDGLELFNLVRRDPTTAETPFLLLAGRDRPTALAAAEAGANMVLTGEVTVDTLLQRVADLVKEADDPQVRPPIRRVTSARSPRAMEPLWAAVEAAAARAVASPTSASFQGSLGVMDLAEVTQAIALGGKTGCLAVTLSAAEGSIFFEAGRLVHAAFAGETGQAAFARLLAASQHEVDAGFRFNPSERSELAHIPRTIARSLDQLLLSIAAGLDEAGTDQPSEPARSINDTEG